MTVVTREMGSLNKFYEIAIEELMIDIKDNKMIIFKDMNGNEINKDEDYIININNNNKPKFYFEIVEKKI